MIRNYRFLGETFCPDTATGFGRDFIDFGCEDALDRGKGNAFIGTVFSDPNTLSRVEDIYIAHWKNPE